MLLRTKAILFFFFFFCENTVKSLQACAHAHTRPLWQQELSSTGLVSPPTTQPTGDFIILTHSLGLRCREISCQICGWESQFYPSCRRIYRQLLHNFRMTHAFLSQEAPGGSLIASYSSVQWVSNLLRWWSTGKLCCPLRRNMKFWNTSYEPGTIFLAGRAVYECHVKPRA